MKTSFTKKISLLAATLALSFTGLSAATTDPVGYVTVSIEGEGKSTIISSGGLVQPSAFTGLVDATGTSVAVSGNPFQGLSLGTSHYIQFDSGDWASIASNTDSSLTLDSEVPSVTGAVATIRPLHTLTSLFGGNNTAGFTGGTGLAAADIVAVFDQASQNFAGLYYYNTNRNQWENSGNQASGGTIIYPDEALVVIGKSPKNIVFSGSVQLGSTKGKLAGVGETSLVPNPYPVDLPVAEAGFENFISGGSTFASADRVFVWDSATQQFSGLYYYDTDDTTWKTAANSTLTSVDVIPAGSAALIVKNQAGPGDWGLDQPF